MLTMVALSIWPLISCSPDKDKKPVVTVSILPQKQLLDQIVGDRVEVKCILGAGANPETYDPTVTNLMGLEKSLAFMRIGSVGFEDAIASKIAESNPNLPIINSSEGIQPIYGTHGAHCNHTDPHTWTSVKNMRIIAQNMAQAMAKVDPANKDYYQKNAQKLYAHLDSLDAELTHKLQSKKGTAFLVWHPSLSYFARDYGLKQIVVGGDENKEASVKQLQQITDSVKGRSGYVFFFQKDFDNLHASAMSNDLKAHQVDISPMEYDWEPQIRKIADSL